VNNNTPVTPVTPNTPNTPNNTNNNANNNGEQKAETGTDITQSSISTPPPTPSSAPPDVRYDMGEQHNPATHQI